MLLQGFVQVYSGDEPFFRLQRLQPGQAYTFWLLVRGCAVHFFLPDKLPGIRGPTGCTQSKIARTRIYFRAPSG